MPISVSHANRAKTTTVLLVEDDVFVRIDLARYLRDEGFVVLECRDGERAIAMCKFGEGIDALVTDIQLDGPTSGWDVADACRTTHTDVPVIYASSNCTERGRSVAGSVFITKPYRNAEIFKALHLLMGHEMGSAALH